jgi:hypothetical protein
MIEKSVTPAEMLSILDRLIQTDRHGCLLKWNEYPWVPRDREAYEALVALIKGQPGTGGRGEEQP